MAAPFCCAWPGLGGGLIEGAAHLFARLEFLNFQVPTPQWWEGVFFFILFHSLVRFRQGARFPRRALFSLILWIIIELSLVLALHLSGNLKVTFLNVGQGDGIFIRFPGGHTMLIDGGGMPRGDFDVGRVLVAPFLLKRRVGRINTMVLSHPHPDHFGGLAHIAENFAVDEFWSSGFPGQGANFKRLQAALRSKGLSRRRFQAGSPTVFIGGVKVRVLHPLLPGDSMTPYYDELDANNNSLVLMLEYGRVRILLTGDIEKYAEEILLERQSDLKSTVLKAPHHGSRSSSTRSFLKAVDPQVIIYSVGEGNQHRFPHHKVLERSWQKGRLLLRTDRDGAITIETDGRTVEIETCRSRRKTSFIPERSESWYGPGN